MEAIFVFTNLDVVLVTSLASQEQNGNARHDAGKEAVQNATFVHVLGISINQTARAAVSTSLKYSRKKMLNDNAKAKSLTNFNLRKIRNRFRSCRVHVSNRRQTFWSLVNFSSSQDLN